MQLQSGPSEPPNHQAKLEESTKSFKARKERLDKLKERVRTSKFSDKNGQGPCFTVYKTRSIVTRDKDSLIIKIKLLKVIGYL